MQRMTSQPFLVMIAKYIPRAKAAYHSTVTRVKTWWLMVDKRSSDTAESVKLPRLSGRKETHTIQDLLLH